jgi:hypothetical protein
MTLAIKNSLISPFKNISINILSLLLNHITS